jgi:hypothetical protein
METVTTDKKQTTTETVFPTTSSLFDRIQGEKALELIMPFLDDIEASQVRRLVVSPQDMAGLGLCYAGLYAEDRGLFLKAFNKEVYDVVSLDNIADRSKGFLQADIRYREASEEQGPLAALMERAKPLRAKLLRAAVYLWEYDPKLGPTVAEIRANQSYLDKGDDMIRLSNLFAKHWAEVEGKCDVTEEEVILAEDLGSQILKIRKSAGSSDISEAKEIRNLAAEYLRRGLEDIVALAAFVFRNDPESLARYPKLFGGKKKTSSKAGEDGIEEETSEATEDASTPTPQVEEADEQIQQPAA